MTTIYLAGPDVFLPDARDVGRRKVDLCARHGLTGLYPLDNTINLAANDASLQIFRGNEAMMNQADAIIANLTPFRGPRADAGAEQRAGVRPQQRLPLRDPPGPGALARQADRRALGPG